MQDTISHHILTWRVIANSMKLRMNIRRSWYRPKLPILSSMSSTVNAIFQGEKRLREWANGADKISKKLPEKGRHTLEGVKRNQLKA